MSKTKQKKQTDPKKQSKRNNEIFALVLALASLGAYGYGHVKAGPAFRDSVAQEKRATTVAVQAQDKQDKARKGKKGKKSKKEADGPEVKAANDAMLAAIAKKEAAMGRVGITAGITLVLGFIGFIVGFISLKKTKWSMATIGKRLTQRIFGIACLLAGSAGLYFGLVLLASIS